MQLLTCLVGETKPFAQPLAGISCLCVSWLYETPQLRSAGMADYAARLARAAAKYAEAEADDACKQLPRDFVATKPPHQQRAAAAAVEAAITAADQIEEVLGASLQRSRHS